MLLIGWVICLRLTPRSIGGIGLLLAHAFLVALGMSWSRLRARPAPSS